MNLYYWCPFIDKVATIKAVMNSAKSVKKFSKNLHDPIIINVVGEWDDYKFELEKNSIKQIKLTNNNFLYRILPRNTFFKSRLSYLIISFYSFIKFFLFLRKRKKNDIIIFHLITSLPLILIFFFNFKCKFALRVSGLPKLNFLRSFLWKISEKNIDIIFVPTLETKINLVEKKIFSQNKVFVLRDPIIEIREIKKKISNNLNNQNTIISIGRLTNQKNHLFLIEAFSEIHKKNDKMKLKILGEGELKEDLYASIKRKKLEKSIELVGYVENIYKYLSGSYCFVSTSKWEDPGFVIIEAAISKSLILSSDCMSGPKEFIEKNEKCGYLYEEGNKNSFLTKFEEMSMDKKLRPKIILNKKLQAYKKTRLYSKFIHYKFLNKYLNSL
jgi:glycosyltransferase involved in cell wall biosynthesis